MRGKLTKRSVGALTSNGRTQILWDRELQRFGVKVSTGGARTYVIQYRAGGRVRRYTIGRHGAPWTPDTARTEALRLLGQVAQGHDPAAAKIGARGAPTVGELIDRFLAAHVGPKLKPRTVAEYKKLCANLLRPALGARRVTDVTRADIARLHHTHRGTPVQANRLLAVCGKMFGLAERWGLRPDGSNPCRHVEKYREGRRERFLTLAEWGRLGQTLTAAERGPLSVSQPDGTTTAVTISPFALAAMRLLALTGARCAEVLGLEWAHVDAERACLRLPDSKTGSKVIHLNAPALGVLAALPRIEGTPYVIAGARTGRPLGGLRPAWEAIRAVAGLPGVRLHDLRHSFASVGVVVGLSLPMIGALLGHSQPATTARYAHLGADPIKAAGEAVGARVAAALGGGA